MPLRIPDRLPAIDLLKQENIFVMDDSRAHNQDIRPLSIVILNLMPLKITTETDLIRLLSNTPLQMDITFMKLKSHTPKNTPVEHMMMFYKDFEILKQRKFDGMIITGAPVETYDFEDVTYWDEMKEIFTWAKTHVQSTLFICWAAQAGLYFHYGIPEIHREDIEQNPYLSIIAEGEESGVSVVVARGGREFYVTGHLEYAPRTLDMEYRRDIGKRDDVELPKNYYRDDNPDNDPLVRWRAHANLFYANWINYYVYQETPYDINQIG